MNVRTCRKCGRLFNYIAGYQICPACKEALEEKFQEVKEYVRDHKGVGINEVAEVCDVDPNMIRQWLREERLELAEDSGIMLACESCGGLIRSGRYCDKCKNNLVNGFNSVLQGRKPAEPTSPSRRSAEARMRFLSDDK
ncbi:MAG: flagellar protein [Lachnospiraceae bacterium]|nr:flagellar protein [Lachnospiraceae bacterium]